MQTCICVYYAFICNTNGDFCSFLQASPSDTDLSATLFLEVETTAVSPALLLGNGSVRQVTCQYVACLSPV